MRPSAIAGLAIILTIGAGTASALIEHALEVRDAARLTANDSFYSARGRRIRYFHTGAGAPGPTAVLISGSTASLEQWDDIQASLSTIMPVVSYDRSGTGFSDPPDAYDAKAGAEELDQLLHSPGIARPFVIVSFSSSSNLAVVFGAQHPDAVKGMVFVDPSVRSPAPGTKSYRRIYWRLIVAGPIAAFFGYTRLKSHIVGDGGSLPASPISDRWHAINSSTHHWLATARDAMNLDASADEAASIIATRPFAHLPVGILTSADPTAGEYVRAVFYQQQQLAAGSDQSIIRVVHVEHTQFMRDPAAITSIIDLIRSISEVAHSKPTADADRAAP